MAGAAPTAAFVYVIVQLAGVVAPTGVMVNVVPASVAKTPSFAVAILVPGVILIAAKIPSAGGSSACGYLLTMATAVPSILAVPAVAVQVPTGVATKSSSQRALARAAAELRAPRMAFIFARRASACKETYFGNAIAAKMAMMVIVITNSIMVKPVCCLRAMVHLLG